MRWSVARLLPVLFVACSAAPTVERSQLWGEYATWDWLGDGLALLRSQDAEIDRRSVQAELGRAVEHELAQLGFTRDRRRPDLRIGLVLDVQSQEVEVFETGAEHTVHSMNHSPNWAVQVTASRTTRVDHARLSLFAIDTERRQVVWRGVLQDRLRGGISPYVGPALARLMDAFPVAGAPAPRGAPMPASRIPARALAGATIEGLGLQGLGLQEQD